MKAKTLNGDGSGSTVKYIVGGLLLTGGAIYGKKAYDKYIEAQAEKSLDTPEGQIAFKLKQVFSNTIVDEEEFRIAYLGVNSSNKDEVFKIYKRLTGGRLLNEDISNRIGSGTLIKADKVEKINSKPDGVIKIAEDDSINFLVTPGSVVKFTDPKKVTYLYATTAGLIWHMADPKFKPAVNPINRVKIGLKDRVDQFNVTQVLLLPYDGVKLAQDWTKYFRPVVSTRKVYAVVRIGIKNNQGKFLYFWVDARDLSLSNKALKGVETINTLI